jgi:glycosyltransferase involved in cell wall biosynthesis
MKLLILITKSNWGGAQRYVYDLATNLPSDTYRVEVMAGGNGPLIDKLREANIQANGDLPINRDINILGDIKVFFKLISLLRDRKPDILHVNSSKIGGLGALAGRLVGIKKIIFTAHGWAFNENRPFWEKIILKINYWIIILLSHTTIAVSEMTKLQMNSWPIINNRITVIYNGINPEPGFSKVNARGELSKLNPELGKFLKSQSSKNLTIVGGVGELHHIKGYDFAIRGMKDIDKNIVYLIIGNGEEKENLEKLIKDLELESKVFLCGFVPQASQYIKAFDIFLLPSLSEGFPYIALEAGLAGLPIIASAVGGIPEIVEDMKSGILIQSRKSREIRHAIEFYMTHKKVQREHALAIHEKVLNDFSIKRMIDETVKIYLSK